MEEAEAALKEIAHLLRRLTATAITTPSAGDTEPTTTTTTTTTTCSSSSSSSRDKDDGVERLFASLAQHHERLTLLKTKRRPTMPTTTRGTTEAPTPTAPGSPQHISYAQLRDFLRHHGVHLPSRRFRALVRFVDSDLCGHVDLQDFKLLLQADHLFCTSAPNAHRPAAARVARLLSQQSQQSQHSPARAVLVDVGRLLRHGSSVLMEQPHRFPGRGSVAAEFGEPEEEI
jgi:hypothetical protein